MCVANIKGMSMQTSKLPPFFFPANAFARLSTMSTLTPLNISRLSQREVLTENLRFKSSLIDSKEFFSDKLRYEISVRVRTGVPIPSKDANWYKLHLVEAESEVFRP